MKAQDYLDSLKQLHDALDRETDELNASKRENHKSWDAHIITLSMASIGFIFVSLPVSTGCYPWVVYVSIFCFVSAIISALLGFLKADKVYSVAIQDHIERRQLAQLATNYHRDYCKDKAILNELEEVEYKESVSNIFKQRDADAATAKIDDINKKITRLNQFKTYFFISGIVIVSIFALLNADKLGTT